MKKENSNKLKDNFVNLHNHCEFSILDGYGKPDWFVTRAKELGQKAIAITDHGNISAHKRWYDACLKEGIKPILGIEAYIVDDRLNRSTREYNHILLLARNLEGYRNLTRLVTLSYSEGFYYKPRIDWEILKRHSKGLIATSGCPSGKIGKNIIRKNWKVKEVKEEMLLQQSIFEKGSYFIELAPWSYGEGKQIAKVIYKAATELKLPISLTMDAHYPREEDAHKQDVMLAIQQSKLVSDKDRLIFDQQDFFVKSAKEMERDWKKVFPDLPFKKSMVDNTAKIADLVDFEFPMARQIEFPYEGDKFEYLKELCHTGMYERGFLGNEKYESRLKLELSLIKEKGYLDYFLVVWDLIKWSKDNDILVGPARGSSCGSLVCYCLHITEIDPLPYDLLFERFIDLNRTDLPDIDIDFEDQRRNEVKGYLESRYGADHVASLATYGTFQGRLCVQDIGRVYADKIPNEVIQEVKKLIVQRSGGDSRFGFTVEDTFVNFDNAAKFLEQYPELGLAKYLEGQVRQMGIHAAGTIISNEPIENFAAFYRSTNDEKVISMDYSDATSIGLLKIDLLGLTTLTVISRTLKLIESRHNTKVDLYKIPLEDQKVYKNFQAGKVFGVFQFDGQAMLQVCKQVSPENFEQLVAVNALSRPGPLHSGGTTSYVQRKLKKEPITYKHKIIKGITESTYGVTIYQEQVMQIVKQLGEFSWADTSTIRKTMSKSRGVEAFDKFQEKFIKGATGHGLPADEAEHIWKEIYTFGSWAFNKSHSVAYTLIGYWCMWLKTYYPQEFYVSMMQIEKQEDKLKRVIKEYLAEKHPILFPDINESKIHYEIKDEGIIAGIGDVEGIGPGMAQRIISKQPFKDYIDFKSRVKVSEKIANNLLRIGAFRNLNLQAVSAQQSLFGDHKIEKLEFDYKVPDKETIRELTPFLLQEKLLPIWTNTVKNALGYDVMPIKSLTGEIEKKTIAIIGTTDPNKYFNPKNRLEEAKSKGQIITKKKGEENFNNSDYDFLNFDIEDETDYVTVRIPYTIYPKYKEMIWQTLPSDVLLVVGTTYNGVKIIFAREIINLTQERRRAQERKKAQS